MGCTPVRTSHTEAYMSSISLEVATASSAVACAVCPSCHRNSALYIRASVCVGEYAYQDKTGLLDIKEKQN